VQLDGQLPGQLDIDPTVLILRSDSSDPLAQVKNNGSFLVYVRSCRVIRISSATAE
jgi:hypothetical protein